MSIKVECRCGKSFLVNDKFSGKTGKCKACGASIKIPIAKPDKSSSNVEVIITCPECKKKVNAGLDFCPDCGSALMPRRNAIAYDDNYSQDDNETNKEGGCSSSGCCMISVVVFFVIYVFGVTTESMTIGTFGMLGLCVSFGLFMLSLILPLLGIIAKKD